MDISLLVSTLRALLVHARPSTSTAAPTVPCSEDGAPPMQTVEPVTIRPYAYRGRVLSFDQNGVTRYACLNLPRQAEEEGSRSGRKWPLFIYLDGSRTTPDSLYTFGRQLFRLHDSYALSDDPAVQGFILLAPGGRRATPWQSSTGEGFHWDEWYRNPSSNLDALAIDHFLDEVIAAGNVDTNRIYVFGWSNGAYMAALYGVWRGDRIAAISQYTGADPWSRSPCPVAMKYTRQVPLILLRNLCDQLVPCETTSAWIETLTKMSWPFTYRNLDLFGDITAPDKTCDKNCSRIQGLFEHVRWPKREALEDMLRFMKQHPLS